MAGVVTRRRTRLGAGALPQGAEKARAVREMFDAIAGRYDLLNRLMTLGMDAGWRRRAVRALGLGPGALVVDLACGTGDLCREAERAGYRPVGTDFAAGMLRRARARTRAPLVQADVLALPFAAGAADGAVSGFALRNVADLAAMLAEAARVLRPGGRIALLEVGEPRGRLRRAGARAWLGRAVPLLGALISDGDAYRYLPRSLAYLPPPAELARLLAAAGFRDVRRRSLSGGIAQLLVASRGATS